MKKIKLTESDLHKIISNSVQRILKEDYRLGWSDETFDKFEHLKEIFAGNEGKLVDEICGKIDEGRLSQILDELIGEYSYNEE